MREVVNQFRLQLSDLVSIEDIDICPHAHF